MRKALCISFALYHTMGQSAGQSPYDESKMRETFHSFDLNKDSLVTVEEMKKHIQVKKVKNSSNTGQSNEKNVNV